MNSSKLVLQTLIKEAIKCYRIQPVSIFAPQKGYRNKSFKIIDQSGGVYNLVIYKREQDILNTIQKANLIGDHLYSKGFPSRSTCSSEKTKPIFHDCINGKKYYLCLYKYLEGETISWEGYTKKHIKLIGQAMSDMHYLLKDFYPPLLLDETKHQVKILAEMEKYFANLNVINAMEKKLNLSLNSRVIPYTIKLIDKLDMYSKIPLHMDFVRGNVLFYQSKNQKTNSSFANKEYLENQVQDTPPRNYHINEIHLTGVIDFEKASYGPRILDISRTLAFLIVDCKYKTTSNIKKYFLHSGYQKRGKSELPDLKYLNNLILFFLLYDFYKFLKHNPYEHLQENEHFVKTGDILIKNRYLVDTKNTSQFYTRIHQN